ncbi:hypothetical protein AYO45_06970 [Gammaproteobacteria bacterium SCGC AG-212-F23]|nr:hypothetical protein AYO45_06970 [Gammaproteobacteria bacterium SCGC AG-212-F23]
MRHITIKRILGVLIVSLIPGMVFAVVDNATLEQKVNQLEQEVQELKYQAHLKDNKPNQPAVVHKQAVPKVHKPLPQQIAKVDKPLPPKKINKPSHPMPTAPTPEASPAPVATSYQQLPGPKTLPSTDTTYLPLDLTVPGQSFVSTGPYIGIPIEYSGNELIINSPNINEDVTLLNVRKGIHKRLSGLGVPEDADRAHLLLSGVLEGQGQYIRKGKGPNKTDVDVTSAGLDGYILGPSAWTTGLLSLAYENVPGPISNTRVSNSRVYVNKAFIIIGNFEKSPFYGSLGQMYVPFGTFSTSMISGTFVQAMARIKARAINIGYRGQADSSGYISGYIFRGDSHVGAGPRVDNGGINTGYNFKNKIAKGVLGVGVVANLADSFGMQFTGNSPLFGGFGGPGASGNENIGHQVPAVDVNALFSIGEHVNLLTEYVRTTKAFARTDLTMNSHGARPSAFNVEGAYSFSVFDHPSSFAVGFGKTQDALALGIPAMRYISTFNISIWRNTLESIEYRQDRGYAASAVASGSQVPSAPGTGKADNAITMQIDLYF